MRCSMTVSLERVLLTLLFDLRFCSHSDDYEEYCFLDVTLCGPVEGHRRFRGTYNLQLRGCRVKKGNNKQDVVSKQPNCCLCIAGFLLGLLFDSEDRGNTFFRIVSELLADYKAAIPEDNTFRRWFCSTNNLNVLMKSL
jgi:hypothetical protein